MSLSIHHFHVCHFLRHYLLRCLTSFVLLNVQKTYSSPSLSSSRCVSDWFITAHLHMCPLLPVKFSRWMWWEGKCANVTAFKSALPKPMKYAAELFIVLQKHLLPESFKLYDFLVVYMPGIMRTWAKLKKEKKILLSCLVFQLLSWSCKPVNLAQHTRIPEKVYMKKNPMELQYYYSTIL